MRLIETVRTMKPHRLVAPLMGYPGTQFTHSTLKQNGFNSELHYRSIYKLLETFAPDVIFPMMDLSVEAGAIGLQIRYPLEGSVSLSQVTNENTMQRTIIPVFFVSWQYI